MKTQPNQTGEGNAPRVEQAKKELAWIKEAKNWYFNKGKAATYRAIVKRLEKEVNAQ